MINLLMAFILFLLCTPALAAEIDAPINDNYAKAEIRDGRTVVYPEVPTFVTLSNLDRNRIVCPKAIMDVRSSEEKGLITPEIAGNEAFLKWFLVEGESGNEYAKVPTEIYIKCGNDRYTLIAIPKEIPAATVYLSGGLTSRVESNERMFKGKSVEEKVVKAITSAYNNDLPDSWVSKTLNTRMNILEGINIVLKRKILIEGEGLDLYEYEVSIAENSGIPEILLDEYDLAARIDGSDNKLAIAVSRLKLKNGMTSRVFLVKTVAGRQS